MALSTPRSHRTLLIAVVAVALAALVVTVLVLNRGPSDEASDGSSPGGAAPETSRGEEPSSPGASPSRTAPVTPLSEEEAAEVTRDALTSTAAALSDPGNPADLSDVLTDAELSAYEAQADEFMATGMHQSGAPTIENARVTSVSEDGTSLDVEACVDSSSVQVLDDQGTDRHASQPKRSLTIFTLTNPDGSWKLASETFPDDPTC